MIRKQHGSTFVSLALKELQLFNFNYFILLDLLEYLENDFLPSDFLVLFFNILKMSQYVKTGL